MSDTFGAVYVSGQQQALAGGGIQGIGPFAIPCSGVQDTRTIVVDTTATVGVPTDIVPNGVVLVPPVGGTVAWTFRTVNGDTGTHLNQALPSVIAFDPNNIPANIYLGSASSVTIVVQYY